MDYLSKNGLLIYAALEKHVKERLKMFDIDEYELKMLANSFHLHEKAAEVCNRDGFLQVFANGTAQVRAEYTVMKNEYLNILKHSAKFGLNPGDRDKIFGGLKDKKAEGFILKRKKD